MRFENVLEIRNGRNQRQVECPNGKYPIYGSGGIMGYANSYICEANTVVIGRKGNINNPIFVEEPFWNVDTAFGLIPHADVLIPKYLFYFCENYNFEKLNTTVTIPSLTKANLLQVEIDVPEIGIQKSRVGILDKIEHSCRLLQQEVLRLDQLVKSRFMEQFGSCLGDETRCATVEQVCTVFTDGDWIESKDQADDGIRLIQTGNVGNGVYLDKGERARYIDEKTFVRLNCTEVLPNDILISRLPDPVGRACIIPGGLGKSITAVDCSIVRLKSNILPEFFAAYTMTTLYAAQIVSSVTGSTRKRISRKNLGQVVIPTPDIEQQERFAAFVAEVDKSKLAVKQSLEKLETLKKSLMQQYFG